MTRPNLKGFEISVNELRESKEGPYPHTNNLLSVFVPFLDWKRLLELVAAGLGVATIDALELPEGTKVTPMKVEKEKEDDSCN